MMYIKLMMMMMMMTWRIVVVVVVVVVVNGISFCINFGSERFHGFTVSYLS
jgi:hypothetical protein